MITAGTIQGNFRFRLSPAMRHLDSVRATTYEWQLRMAFIRTHRLLMLLVALLFAAGHAHQVFGRFELHHHDLGIAAHNHDGDEQDHHDRDGQKDAEHMLADHAVIAVVPALIVSPIVAMHAVALVDMSAEAMPEAPVAGIDHPPQLIG